MVILVDDADRENEGDLILAADHVDADKINFMAKHGRGLICLALTRQRCEQLHLPAMVARNNAAHSTAFTVSIEAAEGVTTGISAADRARTVQVAAAAESTPADLVQPGHIFPLQARDGGVLVRAGHTEAGCDLARMAGLSPAAVICEIMNDDGTMARLADLERFAAEHDLKIGTIADLIAYRSHNETLVGRVATRPLHTAQGTFECVSYLDLNQNVHLALTVGRWTATDDVLVRVHEPPSLFDMLESTTTIHSWPLRRALGAIQAAGRGVALLLNCGESPEAVLCRASTGDHPAPTGTGELRMYGIGAQILLDLGVQRMCLLGNRRRLPSLAGFGLEVSGFRADDGGGTE